MRNFDIKKGSAANIRIAMFIIGMVTVICFVSSNVLHFSGAACYESFPAESEKFNEWMLIPKTFVESGRWDAIVGLFLALIVSGLLMAHSIMQFLKIKKSNIKNEITSSIVNTVVSVVILSFVIYCLTFIFNKEKWAFYDLDIYYITYLVGLFGEKTQHGFAAIGVLLAATLYATVFAGAYNRHGIVKKETNIKMFRITSIFLFSIVMVGLIPIAGIAIGGFRNIEDIWVKIDEAATMNEWDKYMAQMYKTYASVYEIKFLLGIVGTACLMSLCLIPYGILGYGDKQQKNKVIILYSILAGVTLAFFIASAVLVKNINIKEFYKQANAPTWKTKTSIVSAISLISYVLALATGCVAFGTTCKLEAKTKKVTSKHIATK